jgi:hypothetical protein
MTGNSELERLQADLRAQRGHQPDVLFVPEFLLDGSGTAPVAVDGPRFLASCLSEIRAGPGPGHPSTPELVYSIFVPTFASLGGRPGSLLSLLPFLLYLRRELGVDTVLSLPLTVIGVANRKGARGSPFAARDPFAIDRCYEDPLLPFWSAHDLYVAVSEAANCLGIRFGTIAPLATLSIDCPLIARFPDLTYWWRARPGELLVAHDVGAGPVIETAARARFAPAPASGQVDFMRQGDGEVAFAMGAAGELLTPANALPDVSPQMSATYTWEDVVSVNYTRLPYPLPHASYRQAPLDQRRAAWQVMPEAVAWHLRHGERALLIDLQSSVPSPVLARGIDLAYGRARLTAVPPCCSSAANPPLASEEPWIVSEELWTFTGPERADAVVGPFVYCACPYARDAAHLVRSLDHFVGELASANGALPFLAGPATHDTIPVDPGLVRLLLPYLWFLPGAIPFLFSGTEHGITVPVNREFGFTRAEQDALRYDRLQMFSPQPLDWGSWDCAARSAGLRRLVRLLIAARRTVSDHLHSGKPLAGLQATAYSDPDCLATGYAAGVGGNRLVVGANFSAVSPASFSDTAARRGRSGRSVIWAGSGPPKLAGQDVIVAPDRSVFVLLPVAADAIHREGAARDGLVSAGLLPWPPV